MEKRLYFILSCLLFSSVLNGASHRQLTRQESKEVAIKATRILTKEESPILESALERTLNSPRNYNSNGMLEQRDQTIDRLASVQDVQAEEDLKAELMQWAIKELAERNSHEVSQRHGEQKKKWIAATIGLVSTIITIAVPIIFSEGCDCPSDG